MAAPGTGRAPEDGGTYAPPGPPFQRAPLRARPADAVAGDG